MAKFRKKPVVIEAFQWHGEALPDLDWASAPEGNPGTPVLPIPTLEGTMYASLGDWIITGIHGEHYPCKPDIFAATYERVND